MHSRVLRQIFCASFITTVSLLGSHAYAAPVPVQTDGRWYQFDVDELVSASGGLEWIDAIVDESGLYTGDGSVLSFTFTLANPGALTIVDAGFGGDQFSISVNGTEYVTSAPTLHDDQNSGTDFDSALSDNARYSFINIMLGAGEYTVSGELSASALDESGLPYNATVGGLRVSEVPLPAAGWLFFSALAPLFAMLRRRTR